MDSPTQEPRRLVLPPRLLARGVSLRAETVQDVPFLEYLYATVRWPELVQTPWSDEEKVAFLRSQFSLQYQHYTTHYEGTEFDLVLRDGAPIGRIYLHRGPSEYRIVDISLLPEVRGAGVGTALLRAVLDEAAAAEVVVTIHVERFNPAQRLYERLGFREIGGSGPYRLMEWRGGLASERHTHISGDDAQPNQV